MKNALIPDIAGQDGSYLLEKPDGTPRKLMDSGLPFSLGWKPKIALRS